MLTSSHRAITIAAGIALCLSGTPAVHAAQDLPPAPVPPSAPPPAFPPPIVVAPAAPVTPITPLPPVNPLAVPAWDYSNLSLWRTMPAPARIDVVAVSPDGMTIAGGSNGRILLWNMAGEATGQLLDPSVAAVSGAPDVLRSPTVVNDWVTQIAYSPEGKYIATASSANYSIHIWDSRNRTLVRVLPGHQGTISALAWSSDGNLLASGGADKMVKLWDPVTGQLKFTMTQHVYPISAVAFSPDGAVVVSVAAKKRGRKNGEIKFWDSGNGKLLKESLVDDLDPATATVPTGGRILAAAGTLPGGVRLWDAISGTRVRLAKMPRGLDLQLVALAFSPDARVVAGATTKRGHRGKDCTVVLWQVQTGALLHAVSAAPVTSLAFSPDARVVATGSNSNCVQLFRVP